VNAVAAAAVAAIVTPVLGAGGRPPAAAAWVQHPAQPSCPDSARITWRPAAPVAGTLFMVLVDAGYASDVATTSGGATFDGSVADEPLHFRVADGSRTAPADDRYPRLAAIAAVPIDSVRGVTLTLTCADGRVVTMRVPTRAGAYPMEQLRVAPRFAAPPDSALAERMRREAARAAAVSRGAHDTPVLWSGPFMAPRSSRITSGFGGGRTFNGAVTSRHMGTDYAGAVGAPVRAAHRGVVRLVDAFHLGGNVIYVDHGGGLVTAYLHLSRTLVTVGDTVARGAVIGHVGATGRVTGPHLHFIARYGTITVDPASLLAQR
jgi:murein DD-endopeptidase MepM/ murein hydrolase activator NlpD